LAKQHDADSRFLKVTLKNEGETLEIPTSSTVVINSTRPDGTSNSFSGEVNEDGTVTVPIANWMLVQDGELKCDVSVTDINQRKISTLTFSINVDPSANPNGEVTPDVPPVDPSVPSGSYLTPNDVTDVYDPNSDKIPNCKAIAEVLGDIDSALDAIIQLEVSLIGGVA
jgi:hypothetical protein